jgi:hypothetical protein
MGFISVIDTETTWSNALMTAGVLIVNAETLKIVDWRYYVVQDALLEGGIYGGVVHIKNLKEEMVSSRIVESEIDSFLRANRVSSIYAYNASFDKKCLAGLCRYKWHDIMKLAAYKQYNPAIPATAECYKTGKLVRGYGVEDIMRMFGNTEYVETHNALLDARDELGIMVLLGHDLGLYPGV